MLSPSLKPHSSNDEGVWLQMTTPEREPRGTVSFHLTVIYHPTHSTVAMAERRPTNPHAGESNNGPEWKPLKLIPCATWEEVLRNNVSRHEHQEQECLHTISLHLHHRKPQRGNDDSDVDPNPRKRTRTGLLAIGDVLDYHNGRTWRTGQDRGVGNWNGMQTRTNARWLAGNICYRHKRFPWILFAPFHSYFSKVDVFELGHTYLQLVQTLNLRLPLVIPTITCLNSLPSWNLGMKHTKWRLMPYDWFNDSIEIGWLVGGDLPAFMVLAVLHCYWQLGWTTSFDARGRWTGWRRWRTVAEREEEMQGKTKRKRKRKGKEERKTETSRGYRRRRQCVACFSRTSTSPTVAPVNIGRQHSHKRLNTSWRTP